MKESKILLTGSIITIIFALCAMFFLINKMLSSSSNIVKEANQLVQNNIENEARNENVSTKQNVLTKGSGTYDMLDTRNRDEEDLNEINKFYDFLHENYFLTLNLKYQFTSLNKIVKYIRFKHQYFKKFLFDVFMLAYF